MSHSELIVCYVSLSEAVKANMATSCFSQAELEEQLSTYFINSRDRKGGRKERANLRMQRDLSRESSTLAPVATSTASVLPAAALAIA